MNTMSKQFSLREMIGSVAPGAMVLLSVFYVLARIPALHDIARGASGWSALLVGFVISYGVGTLLTSLTEAVFDAVTKLGAVSPLSTESTDELPTTAADRVYRSIDQFVKRAASYLSGGQDITATIRQFRESWTETAVDEGVVSQHAFSLSAGHYRALFDAEPTGEESLLVCEYYIRERMPTAMQEIEQNAAKAALMGNLIIPVLFWVVAVGAGIVLSLINKPRLIGTVTELILFGILLVIFPYIVRMIGRQWTEASRNRVRIVVLAFTIACRLSSPTVSTPSIPRIPAPVALG
jgi:hypothetical protein